MMDMRQSKTSSCDLPRYITVILMLLLVLSMRDGVTESATEHKYTGYRLQLPSSDFGRENPFMPLVLKSPIKKAKRNSSSTSEAMKSRTDTGSPDAEPAIRLMAIIMPGGAQSGRATAIIEENGVSRSVSVGDTVAEMEVLEIRRGEVSLNKGDEVYKLTLGVVTERR